MRVDLHCHTWYSPDGMMSPERLVRLAKRRGLHAIAITDHNRLTRVEDKDVLVIPGEEIKTKKGEVIGLFLEEEIPRGLEPDEVFDRIREQGGLILIPHPFDRFRAKTALLLRFRPEDLPRGTLIEVLNARYVSRKFLEEARRLVEAYGFPAVGSSDAHTPVEVGKAWTEVPPFGDREELFEHLRRGKTRPAGSFSPPWVHLTVFPLKMLHAARLIP